MVIEDLIQLKKRNYKLFSDRYEKLYKDHQNHLDVKPFYLLKFIDELIDELRINIDEFGAIKTELDEIKKMVNDIGRSEGL